MDQNLFENDMLFVADNKITYDSILENIKREKSEKPKEVKNL